MQRDDNARNTKRPYYFVHFEIRIRNRTHVWSMNDRLKTCLRFVSGPVRICNTSFACSNIDILNKVLKCDSAVMKILLIVDYKVFPFCIIY